MSDQTTAEVAPRLVAVPHVGGADDLDGRDFLDLDEVGRRLSLSRRMVYALIADGQLMAAKVGRRRLVTVESYRALRDGLLAEATAMRAAS